MDWAYWHTAAKALDKAHVTVARDYTDALADLVEPLVGEEHTVQRNYINAINPI